MTKLPSQVMSSRVGNHISLLPTIEFSDGGAAGAELLADSVTTGSPITLLRRELGFEAVGDEFALDVADNLALCARCRCMAAALAGSRGSPGKYKRRRKCPFFSE